MVSLSSVVSLPKSSCSAETISDAGESNVTVKGCVPATVKRKYPRSESCRIIHAGNAVLGSLPLIDEKIASRRVPKLLVRTSSLNSRPAPLLLCNSHSKFRIQGIKEKKYTPLLCVTQKE